MLMKLIVVLSNQIEPFGKVFNAIGHMMVGMGPRFPQNKFPTIELYASSRASIRQFRTEAARLHAKLPMSAFSDFSHTTTEGTAQDHARQTRAIRESEIDYWASCICAPSTHLNSLSELLNDRNFSKLKLTFPASSPAEADFDLSPPITYPDTPDFVEDDSIFSISLSNKLSTADALYQLVRACITLGNTAERHALRLHQYPDADNVMHPGMSEYGLVALKAKSPAKLQEVNQAAAALFTTKGRINSVALNAAAVGLFGKKVFIKEITSKNCSLWNTALSSGDYLPLISDNAPPVVSQFTAAAAAAAAASPSASTSLTPPQVTAREADTAQLTQEISHLKM